jgi:hypothetical protein
MFVRCRCIRNSNLACAKVEILKSYDVLLVIDFLGVVPVSRHATLTTYNYEVLYTIGSYYSSLSVSLYMQVASLGYPSMSPEKGKSFP